MLKLFNRFVLDGPFLVFNDENDAKNYLVVSDLHLGYSDYLVSKGIFSLLDEFQRIKEILSKVQEYKINNLILNGDIIHDFGSFPNTLKRKLRYLVEHCREFNCKPFFILGNHDVQLKYFLNNNLLNFNLDFDESLLIGDVFITHGHKFFELPKEARFLIIGHEHPAELIEDTKFKAYWITDYKSKKKKANVIIMPSFFDFTEGTHEKESSRMSAYRDSFTKISARIIISKHKGRYLTLPLELTDFISFEL